MKKAFLTIAIFTFCAVAATAQFTKNFKPVTKSTKDAVIFDAAGSNDVTSRIAEKSDFLTRKHGSSVISRQMLKFDLARLSENLDQLVSAQLVISSDKDLSGSFSGQQATISRINKAWGEQDVFWKSADGFSVAANATPFSVNAGQQTIEVDITNLLKDMVADKENDFGLLIRSAGETKYENLLFATTTGDAAPKVNIELKVKYSAKALNNSRFSFTAFPNPVLNTLNITSNDYKLRSGSIIKVLNNLGQEVANKTITNVNVPVTLSMDKLPSDMYKVVIYENNQVIWSSSVMKK
jgi:hypothetical protein